MVDSKAQHDAWRAGDSYDAYMGRWSRRIASRFIDWLAPSDGLEWLELGCGTGALTHEIVARSKPLSVLALEPSEGFVAVARRNVVDAGVTFQIGDATALPEVQTDSADVAISGLVLNFVPDKPAALRELRRIVRRGGKVAFYVWDYPGGGLEFLDIFWQEAISLDRAAAGIAEDRRFDFCTLEAMSALASGAGLNDVRATALEAETTFQDFDDFWRPFTLGAGPAPGYFASLDVIDQERLRDALQRRLPLRTDGSIQLGARAWAIGGTAG